MMILCTIVNFLALIKLPLVVQTSPIQSMLNDYFCLQNNTKIRIAAFPTLPLFSQCEARLIGIEYIVTFEEYLASLQAPNSSICVNNIHEDKTSNIGQITWYYWNVRLSYSTTGESWFDYSFSGSVKAIFIRNFSLFI